MTEYRFAATLQRLDGPGTLTYLLIPLDLAAIAGRTGHIPVQGTINGHPFRHSAMPFGDGTHFLLVTQDIHDAIRATPGTTVSVTLALDNEERPVALPDDFQAALAADGQAHAFFADLSFARRKACVDWIEAARTATTRSKRIHSVLAELARGLAAQHGQDIEDGLAAIRPSIG